jgi:hypothetical protein
LEEIIEDKVLAVNNNNNETTIGRGFKGDLTPARGRPPHETEANKQSVHQEES